MESLRGRGSLNMQLLHCKIQQTLDELRFQHQVKTYRSLDKINKLEDDLRYYFELVVKDYEAGKNRAT